MALPISHISGECLHEAGDRPMSFTIENTMTGSITLISAPREPLPISVDKANEMLMQLFEADDDEV